MTQIPIILLSFLLLAAIFLRRWYLLEKGQMFGKMVLKRGLHSHSKLTKEDHEITIKEMIPESGAAEPKKALKADTLYRKSEIQLKKQNLKEVEKLLIEVIALNPGHILAHASLGRLYLTQNQYSKAEVIYRKLIVAVQDEPMYFNNLGLSLYHQKKLEDAKAFYLKALSLDNTRPGRHFSLAQVLYELGEFEEALMNLQNAIALDPSNIDYALTMAHWYLAKDLNLDAKKLLEDILAVYPDNTEAREMLGQVK